MSSPRPPGWYDEPSGDPALLRWWDGQSWTAVTRSRAAAEETASGEPQDLLDSEERRPSGPSRRVLVGAGIGVALVALLLLVGLPAGGGSDGDGLADPRPSGPQLTASPTPAPTPAPTTARPVTGRITDRVARLSYDVLPGEWREWDRETFGGLESTAGYYRVTQDSAPNAQTYWANVSSGQLDPDRIRRGNLASSAGALADVLARGYYPGHTRSGETRRALTVDGAPAYLVRYTAVFDPESSEGYSAKSESVAVLVVDTGEDVPSALYVSLPDTVRDLWPALDSLLASVRIVR